MRSVIVTEDQHLVLLLALNDRLALLQDRMSPHHFSTEAELSSDAVQLESVKQVIRLVSRAGAA